MTSLADFLASRRDAVVARFKERVGGTLAPRGLSESELQDHLPDFLDTVVQALRERTSPTSRVFAHNATAEEHGRQRLSKGFSLDALVREYGLLRDCVFELLEEADEAPTLRELRVFADCISAATADSVTQYVQHQQALLRQSEERLQAILDNAPAAVYVKDLEGRWTTVNRHMEVLFGRSRAELLGRRDEELMAPEAAATIRANDARVLASNTPLESEEELPLAQGPRTYLSLKFPLCDARGLPVALCGISTDITERRHMQDFQQRLLGIVGHDVRGPLSAITLSAATLQGQQGLSPAQQRVVKRIAHSAERIDRLITLLLDFTRAQLGLSLPLRPTPTCLGALAERVVDEVQAAHPERAFHVDAQGDTCGEWDADRLMQVLGNLVSNALRYSPEGALVSVRVQGERHTVVLRVHNQGPPIPEAVRPYLFMPFRRGLHTGGSTSEGLGLGLYIVREVVQAHGGSLTVDSTAEQGTTFSVQLPRRPPARSQGSGARPAP